MRTDLLPQICVCAIALVVTVDLLASDQRDVVSPDGASTYLRRQRTIPPYGLFSGGRNLDAEYGRCALSLMGSDGPDDFAALQQFSRWGSSLHDALYSHPDIDLESAQWTRPACGPWCTWSIVASFGNYGRVFDPLGEPLTPTFVISDAHGPSGFLYVMDVAVNGEHAVVLFREVDYSGITTQNIWMRRYDPDGTPRGEIFVVADYWADEIAREVAIMPDGTAFVAYVFGESTIGPFYPEIRRVDQDETVSPPVRISDEECEEVYARALDDGTILVAWKNEPPGTGAFVQRFSTELEPIGEPHPIDDGYARITAAPNGRLAQLFPLESPGLPIVVRLYDAEWNSIGERMSVQMPGTPESKSISGLRPIAIQSDGTVWVTWNSYMGGPTHLLTLTPFEPGDMNYDGLVNNFDIDPFVLALTDPEEYQQLYPELPYQFLGDLNFDGDFNNFDIDPFVDALTAP